MSYFDTTTAVSDPETLFCLWYMKLLLHNHWTFCLFILYDYEASQLFDDSVL